MEGTLMERLRRMADRVISERPSDRVLNFTLDGEKYWIKRKLGNGRNQLVKYSVEKEFYYEIARMTIAGRNNPDLVPEIEVLTPDYMVTKDGGPTVKNRLGQVRSREGTHPRRGRRSTGCSPQERHRPWPSGSPRYHMERRSDSFP